MMNFPIDAIRWLPLLVFAGQSRAGSDAHAGGGSGDTGVSGGGGSPAGKGGAQACGESVSASAANNYSFSSRLSFSPIGVKPDSNLSFEWGELTSDLLGREIDPLGDIDQVTILMCSCPREFHRPPQRSESIGRT